MTKGALKIGAKAIPITIDDISFHTDNFTFRDKSGAWRVGELTIFYRPAGMALDMDVLMSYLSGFGEDFHDPEELVAEVADAVISAVQPLGIKVVMGIALHNRYSASITFEHHFDEEEYDEEE
jgi:NADPH-dependent 7-cyano-7-deazaguanine reductase QueF